MDYKRRIESIIDRATQLNAPLQDVCAEAEVSKSTLYRWQQQDANPRMRDMLAALDRLEAALAKRERRMLAAIAARDPEMVADALAGGPA